MTEPDALNVYLDLEHQMIEMSHWDEDQCNKMFDDLEVLWLGLSKSEREWLRQRGINEGAK